MTDPGSPAEATAKRVTPFELFFDLVFVFALTQVTRLMIDHPTPAGVARGLLVLALLWWAWGAYAWLTNAVSTESRAPRLVILAAMAAMMVVGIAVPQAAGLNALAFALAYFVVRVLHLVLYAVAGGTLNRAAILRLAPGNLAASVLLIVGAFVPSSVQLGLWAAAVLVDYGTPLLTGVGGFTVHAAHFFERHHLFFIIALGETIVSIGGGVLIAQRITPISALGIVLALAAIGGLWWTYFDWEAQVSAQVLSNTTGASRAYLARDMFSYLHMPLVTGVVFMAIGLEHVTGHPTDTLSGLYRFGLGGGAALFLVSLAGIRGRRGHRQRLDHLVGALVCLALIPVAGYLPGLVTLGLLIGVLLVVALVDRTQASTDPPIVGATATPAQ
ncbi:MAG: low temperature requirement protein A [Micromonosporaceae bacterium]|nr:low temperature requirement protein A [Micromonosporaceae bacterium]